METKGSLPCLKKATILNQLQLVHIFKYYISRCTILTSSFHLPLILLVNTFKWCFQIKILCAFLFISLQAVCPIHLIYLYSIIIKI
jgi:hypothetical protein